MTNEEMFISREKEELESYTRSWKIFIDTCSLLHPSADKFWLNIIPLLHQNQNKIIVLWRSLEELENHSNNNEKRDLASNAKNCLKIVKQLINAGVIELRGESTDNFADNVFQVVFTKFRINNKLLLITQDNDLAKDIIALNNNKSVKAIPVQVKKINQLGFLSDFNWMKKGKISEKSENKAKKGTQSKQYQNEIFRICSSVTCFEDSKLNISKLPSVNDLVYTTQEAIRLEKELGAGGEAKIYSTNTSLVAKIYKEGNITKRKYEKIKLMLTKKISCPGICYPVEVLYNEDNEFVGYLMPAAKGQELQKSVFAPKPVFLKKLPGWKKRDTVELCITILKKIKYLHDRNIIIGDINPANILVVSPQEVYMVDTDSFQIEDFPCPVGTINFTAPEIQKKRFPEFLRTMGNENFAVATLLFMIMLPGKPPYSQQGGEDPISNIIKMDFSYPFGESSNKKTPEGPWRYIWSHLTYDLKEAFYHTFRINGKYSLEQKRLSVDDWLIKFREFLELLDSGRYGQQDKMSEELFPTRHKKNPKVTYIKCRLCNNEVEEERCKDGICRACLDLGERYTCKKCGKEILYTNYQKYIKKSKKHEICSECYEQGKQIRIRQRCIDCGKVFELTNNQYEFYVQKGYEIPKRCEMCRILKRNNQYNSNSTRTDNSFRTNSSSTGSNFNGSFCFITTAVCEYYGKPDNCEELELLRNYRDSWLMHQVGGKELVQIYYNSAPLIVSKLKASMFYGDYCQVLMEKYIKPCIQYINSGRYEECKELYISMVKYANTLC